MKPLEALLGLLWAHAVSAAPPEKVSAFLMGRLTSPPSQRHLPANSVGVMRVVGFSDVQTGSGSPSTALLPILSWGRVPLLK